MYTLLQNWLVRLPIGSPRGRIGEKMLSSGKYTTVYSFFSTPAPLSRMRSTSQRASSSRTTWAMARRSRA
jgi:hypothetical protein